MKGGRTNDRDIFLVEIVLAIALGLLGIYKHDMLVATYSAMSLVFSWILFHESKKYRIDPKVSIISSLTLLVCSLVFLFVLNYDSDPFTDKRTYAHIEGFTAWLIAYPLAYLATECIVILFGASLNRFLVSGFMVFNSEALTSLMLISVSIFSTEHLDKSFMFVDELSYLFMGVVMSLIAAVIMCRALRGKDYLMCRERLEAER